MSQHRISHLATLVFMLGALGESVFAAEPSWVSVGAKGQVEIQGPDVAAVPQVTVHESSRTRLEVVVDVPGLAVGSVKNEHGSFVRVNWHDAPMTGEVGAPAIPVVRRLFVVPPGAMVRVSADVGEGTAIDSEALGFPPVLEPVQPPIPKIPGARENAEFAYDPAAYLVDGEIAPLRATIEELGIVRGQRLFLLTAYPLTFNPARRCMTFWPKISVRIRFEGGSLSAGDWSPMPGLARNILNPEMLPHARGGGRSTGNYVIIVASVYESDITAFASAKQAQGFNVTTWTAAPGTSNTAIKSYIEGLWGDPGNEPDYILLVGDTDTIPHWVGGGTGSPDTDIQYACMDGASDWYPDIAIGRFPARSSAQVGVLVDKTLYYENGPLVDPQYKKRSAFMASVDNYQISEGTHNYVINTHLEPNGYIVDRLYQVTYGATTQDVRDALNDGRFYGVYSGHGSTTSWADGPPFSQTDVNNLTNADLYAFICSFACLTGEFTYPECFMETWVLAPDKAAVTAWGSSVNSYWTEDDILEKRLFDVIFDNDDEVKTEAGPVYNETKVRYLAHFGPTGTTRRYFEMYNLMGDPALPLPSACSDAGEVALDRAEYACESTALIAVADCGLNLDDNIIDTAEVTIASGSEPAGELVALYETDAASAEFEGTIDLSQTNATGVLLIAEGDTITVTYIDADDGKGGVNVEVVTTAAVDCTPPNISGVQITDVQPRSATIKFNTDEPCLGSVLYGPDCSALPNRQSSSGYDTTVTVNLSGLQDNTTYFFAVEAEDEAGNVAGDDNGGSCYMFTTPEVPDFFAEEFTNDNDLDNTTLLFTPSGGVDFYAGCAESITELPTDPAGGTLITLGDDASQAITLSGGSTVSLYEPTYSSFYVGSNGYITFGSGDSDYDETLGEHFSMPRIAALYDDLNPSTGGMISWKQLSDRAVVTYENVPEHSTSNSNTFQIEMYFNGDLRISFLGIAATDGIAGLSEGNGLDPDFFESDLSNLGACGPRPPTAHNVQVSTPVSTPVTVHLEATDDGLPEPPALTYIVTSLPGHGDLVDSGNGPIGAVPYTLVNNGSAVEYQPEPDYSGPDTFQFKASDGGVPPEGGDSNEALVSITIGGPEWDPVAYNMAASTALSTACDVTLSGSDPNGDDLVCIIKSLPALGSLSDPGAGAITAVPYVLVGGGDVVTYMPPLDQSLQEGFDFCVSDATAISNIATVTMTVGGPLWDPVAYDMQEGTAVSLPTDIALSASDPNGDPLVYFIESLPAAGGLRDPGAGPISSVPYALVGGNVVTYTPPFGQTLQAAFDFSVRDATAGSNVATVTVDVGAPHAVYSYLMDADPGWATSGQWTFGQPTGGGTGNGDPTSGHTGNNVYGYNLGGDYENDMQLRYLTTGPIDCTHLVNTELRFWRCLGVESSFFDHANIQISTNGLMWMSIWNHDSGTIDEGAWSFQDFDISTIADGRPVVFFRWGMGPTDVTNTHFGWNLDDIVIWGLDATPVPLQCDELTYTPGDLNLDGSVDGLDVQVLVQMILNPNGGWVVEQLYAADFTGDEVVDPADVGSFVEALLN